MPKDSNEVDKVDKMRIDNEVKIAVRELIEFVLRSGSIDNRFTGKSNAVEGIKGHQKVQKSYTDEYESEVRVKYELEYKDIKIVIDGRIDGVIKSDNNVTIDEIKTTTHDLEFINEDYNSLHWAQAMCYAYMYSDQNNIKEINVQLTYFQLEINEVKKFNRIYNKETLEDFFNMLISKYYEWAKFNQDWCNTRDVSIKQTQFPFAQYRKGQREFAVLVYKSIVERKKLFAQIPTGTGKTISTLFPSIKSLGEGKISKIFYLTAKTSTRFIAEETIDKLVRVGLRLKTTTITAKEKLCFMEKTNCNPIYCEYAKGHYDRVNEALYKAINTEDIFTRDIIEKYSREYKVCPFEFTLDLTLFSDCIICDYNYAFDPKVYLKRHFENKDSSELAILVDESHNLPERAREMFSAELYKSPILSLQKQIQRKSRKLSSALGKLNKFMVGLKKLCDTDSYFVDNSFPQDINVLLQIFIREAEEYLLSDEVGEEQEELLQFYFDSLNFIKISEFYDERYVTYIENTSKDTKIKLFCLDPSHLLSQALKRAGTAIFFSATLIPMEYFQKVLGGGEDDKYIRLNSPFDTNNRVFLIADRVSTKYKYRENSYDKIAEYIGTVVRGKIGNYIAFFPSYQYMNEIYKRYIEIYPNDNAIIQTSNMSEQEKIDFLEKFKDTTNNKILGFCVLGGTYAEGIDLTEERLIGTIIVGVGLPQICLERNIIKDYFQGRNGKGYEYSYVYPGFIKILQGVGRLIRTENDKGVILLIDERYSEFSYRKLFPKEWYPNVIVRNKNEISKTIKEFWNQV